MRIVRTILLIFFLFLVFGCANVGSSYESAAADSTLIAIDTSSSSPEPVRSAPARPPAESRLRQPPMAARPPMAAPPAAGSPPRATQPVPERLPPIHEGTDDVTYEEVPDEISEVDAILDKLKKGGVLFDSPDTMYYKTPRIVEVILYPSVTAMPSPGVGQDTGIAYISSRMEATLTGEGFFFVSQTPEIQAISSRTPTKWSWQVTPQRVGDLSLHLSLLARINVEGKETSYVIQTFSRDIDVKITTKDRVTEFFGENWKWMWGALLIPLLGFIFKKFKERK